MRIRRITAAIVALCAIATVQRSSANPLTADPDTPYESIFCRGKGDDSAVKAKSLRVLEETLKSDPKDFQALMKKGKLLREMHRDAEAIQCYTKAIAINSDSARGHKQRGLTYLSLKQYADAASDLDRAANLTPNDLHLIRARTEAQSHCAYDCYMARNYADAIKHMDIALIDLERERASNPNSLVSRLKIGLAYLQTAQAAELSLNAADAKRRNLEARKNFEIAVAGKFGPPEVDTEFQTQARILFAKSNLALREPTEALKAIEVINTKSLSKGDQIQVLQVKMHAYEQLGEETKATELEVKLEELGAGANWNKSVRSAQRNFPAEINNTRKKNPTSPPPEFREKQVGVPLKFPPDIDKSQSE